MDNIWGFSCPQSLVFTHQAPKRTEYCQKQNTEVTNRHLMPIEGCFIKYNSPVVQKNPILSRLE